MELLIAIAQLCLLPTGTMNQITYVERTQLECQQYYVKCLNDKTKEDIHKPIVINFKHCILERKIK